ncbi:hypothetical protein LZ31DRAFT_631800 [Colletotrichum somersetense]|nr:hypothetical protein LZ31DRAFT_631800 [Colletotrichum somersetense]
MASEKTEVPVTEGPVDETSPTSSARGQEPNKKKTLYERATSFFGDWYYVWEVFGILISGLAIIAICMVVFRFNKKEVPKWETKVPGINEPFRLTINSLLSMLSVLSSTCAMIPVTKSLGQLNMFLRPSPSAILGLVLFVGVVIKTRRAQIKAWRTSPLATLLLRLDPDSREHLKDWQNMGDAELKDVAKELRQRLQMDESGPRFVRTAGPPS